MQYSKVHHARFVSAALSAVLVLAAACGDDSSSDEAPKPTMDASAGSKPDASTPSSNDGGVEVDPDRLVDAGDEPSDASTGPAPDAASGLSAAALRGKALADENVCTSCHQSSYAGAGFYPNITPDMATGIGSWTDKQISDAISKGVDAEGEELCSLMTRYEFSAAELTDLVAFLRSVPAKANKITGTCPSK